MTESKITVIVEFKLNATMWDCLKMRVLKFTKDQILEYLENLKQVEA